MPLLANSACAVKLLEESGTLVSQSGFSNMVSINLDLQPSGSNPDSEERNQVRVKGHKELQLQESFSGVDSG